MQSLRFTYDAAADSQRQSASSALKHITSRFMVDGHALMLQMYAVAKFRDQSPLFVASLMQAEPTESRMSITTCHVHHSVPVCSIQIGLHLAI